MNRSKSDSKSRLENKFHLFKEKTPSTGVQGDEIGSTNTPLRLCCLIDGEEIVFGVDVSPQADVSDLKKIIYHDQDLQTQGVRHRMLGIWKPRAVNAIPSKPPDTLLQRIRLMGVSLPEFAEELDPMDILSDVFPVQPSRTHVQIIVKTTVSEPRIAISMQDFEIAKKKLQECSDKVISLSNDLMDIRELLTPLPIQPDISLTVGNASYLTSYSPSFFAPLPSTDLPTSHHIPSRGPSPVTETSTPHPRNEKLQLNEPTTKKEKQRNEQRLDGSSSLPSSLPVQPDISQTTQNEPSHFSSYFESYNHFGPSSSADPCTAPRIRSRDSSPLTETSTPHPRIKKRQGSGFAIKKGKQRNDDPDLHSIPGVWSVKYNDDAQRALDINLVHTLTHDADVRCVGFSKDGKYLAIGCRKNGTILIYDVKSGRKKHVLRDITMSEEMYIWNVCFSPDDRYLASGGSDRKVTIWNMLRARPHVRNAFHRHNSDVISLDFFPNGKSVISCTERSVYIWSLRDGAVRVLDQGHVDICGVHVSSNRLVALPVRGSIFVLDGRTSSIIEEWVHDDASSCDFHSFSGQHGAFSPDGARLLSCCCSKLKSWDVSKYDGGRLSPRSTFTEFQKCDKKEIMNVELNGPAGVTVSHDGKWVISSSHNTVTFWAADTGIGQCGLYDLYGSNLCLDASRNYLAFGNSDGTVFVWKYE